MVNEAGLTFRAAGAEDLPFVMDSWGRSYRRGNKAFSALSPDDFHRFHRPIRERILGRAHCLIVAGETEPWLILGWIVHESIPSSEILHYVYVRDTFKREFGLAHQLVNRAIKKTPCAYTHLTHRASRILSAKAQELSGFYFAPHLI